MIAPNVPQASPSNMNPLPKPSSQMQQRRRAVSEPKGKSSPTLGNRLRNLLPRHRPERGGTIRNHGFWEEHDSTPGSDTEPRRDHVASSQQLRRSETTDSNRLTRWNTAKELPQKPAGQTPAHRRAASVGIEALMALSPNRNRKWSWSPPEDRKLANSLQNAAKRNNQGGDPVSETLARQTSKLEAAIIASRRLSQARQLLQARKEKRHMRRSLKESGDYLGVQGINPETGQLDIETPSDSEHSTVDYETEQRLDALKQVIKDAPSSQSPTIARAEREIQRILTRVRNKNQKVEQEKIALAQASKTVRWRRQTKQWSSAQEPDLSPIAQSLANMSPTTSPKPSASGPPTRDGILIDLSSPKVSPQVFDSLDLPSADISGSSGTVVRTPHPQNTAEVSPSARVLFENGISFDSFLKETGNKGSDVLQSVRPDRATRVKLERPTKDASPSEPGDNRPNESFLEIRTAQRSDPGVQPRTSNAIPQGLSMRLGIGQSLLKDQGLKVRETKDNLSLEQGLPSAPDESSTITISPGSRPHLLSEENRVEECDLTFLLGPQDSRASLPLERTEQPQVRRTRFVEINGEAVFRGRSRPPTRRLNEENMKSELSDTHLMEKHIQTELNELRNMLEELDLPTKKSIQKETKSNETEQTWAQAAIQDITSRGNEPMEESVSIPTITTIGSGQSMFPSNQSREQVRVTSHQRNRNPRRPAYNPSNKLRSMAALESLRTYQTKTILNSSPSREPQSEIPAADTISAHHKEFAQQRSQEGSPTALPELTDNTPLVPPQSSSISRMFMSMVRQDKEAKNEKASVEKNMEQKSLGKEVDGEARPSDNKVRPSAPKKEPMGKFSGRPREQGPPPQPAKLRKHCVVTNQEALDLTGRIPGSYPGHLHDDDDIVDLFNVFRLEKDRRAKRPGLGAALKEVAQTVGVNGIWLLRLYWATVRPVFNVESEIWVRNVSHTSTWKDCASLILATPAVLVLIMCLV